MPPQIGARISNLRGLRAGKGPGASGLGPLGLLAIPAGARDWSHLFLISNRHVLLAHGAGDGDPVYHPRYRRANDRLVFDPAAPVIAMIAGEGVEGHHRYAYPGERPSNYFVDCAAARIVGPWDVGGRSAAGFRSIGRAHALDAIPGQAIGLRILGRHAQIAGTLAAVDATVLAEDGSALRNNIMIRALPGPEGRGRFAEEGDSGALIVDARDRAVGLLWGVSRTDPAVAYACHLHPVLDCLGLIACRYALAPRPAAKGGADGPG